jgi:hypothetical protein
VKIYRLIGLAIVLALFISSCSTSVDTANTRAPLPNEIASQAGKGQLKNMDEALIAIEKKLGGFGGMYFANGKLNVVLAGGNGSASQKASAKSSIAAIMGSNYLRQIPRGSVADENENSTSLPAGTEVEVNVVPGKYKASQLLAWKRSAGSAFSVKGVVYIDFDEVANRVRVGVEKGTSKTAVENALKNQKVPLEAVIISETAAIKPMATLQDRIRPTFGGLQLNWDNDNNFANGSWVCTLGFNATWYGYKVFLTNSHCSGTQGGTQYVNYYQNSYYGTNTYIGYEWYDPTYAACTSYSGYVCRWSDSAIAYQAAGNPALGRVYRTTNFNGSLTLAVNPNTGAYKKFNIVAEWDYPTVGYAIDKEGRTTGWTYGTVTNTCVDTGVSGTNIVLLCQDFVQRTGYNIVAGGDSGSPAFYWYGGAQIALSGLLWGGGSSNGVNGDIFVFSPMGNIEYEMGELVTPY